MTSAVVTSIVGLVVEYTVAIGVTRVRFPDDAFFIFYEHRMTKCDGDYARFWSVLKRLMKF